MAYLRTYPVTVAPAGPSMLRMVFRDSTRSHGAMAFSMLCQAAAPGRYGEWEWECPGAYEELARICGLGRLLLAIALIDPCDRPELGKVSCIGFAVKLP
jgi:hypothetical protein